MDEADSSKRKNVDAHLGNKASRNKKSTKVAQKFRRKAKKSTSAGARLPVEACHLRSSSSFDMPAGCPFRNRVAIPGPSGENDPEFSHREWWHQGAIAIDDSDPIAGFRPANPGSSTSIANPGSSTSIANPGSSASVADTGPSARVADPGSSASVADPGSSASVADPGSNASVADPGSNASVADPGPSNGIADPEPSNDAADPPPGVYIVGNFLQIRLPPGFVNGEEELPFMADAPGRRQESSSVDNKVARLGG